MSIQAVGQNSTQSVTTPPSQSAGGTPSTSKTTSTSSPSSYTVSISGAARAALLEATETSVQTAQEANRGDLQAKRLLAKEQASKAL
ncbi:hypothetical protein [Paraburkholderia phymatum]|uniref:hypothetical protein n=1 Tax=Paraburkholderia phymatum TaxID=148447 RepID=UPI0034D16109